MATHRRSISVSDKMQSDYTYEISELPGKNFHPDFKPDLTPKQMLELGVFGGRYMRDCTNEFPKDWFTHAKFHPIDQPGHDPELNLFKVDASQPLSVWREKGWINEKHDPRGWFQWYARYFIGRRLPEEDEKQVKRWKAMRRHVGQIKKNCRPGDIHCHTKQRQALLHWAYDSRYL
ncbi:MAG TPA: hypothetical protein PLF31_00755 [Candidatus Paceibacterota bacterium]|nr:hypothetical protein [Candidatus Paceibacterota bacterium]